MYLSMTILNHYKLYTWLKQMGWILWRTEEHAKGKEIPFIPVNGNIKDAVKIMAEKKLGIVCVKVKNGKINLITDGDIRRNSNNLFKKKIIQVCNKKPTWILDTATALSAIEKMNSLKITSLLVANRASINKERKNVIGIIHLHHCLSRGIKWMIKEKKYK